MLGEESLPGALEGRVVVGVKVVEAEHSVPTLFEGKRAMRPNEPGSPGDEDREPIGAAGRGGVPHLLLPGGTTDRRRPAGERLVGQEGAAVGVSVGEGRVVEGEEEDEDECDKEGGPEEELRGGVEELRAVDSPDVAVVALELVGRLARVWRRGHWRSGGGEGKSKRMAP